MDPVTPDKSRSGEKTSDDSSSSKVLELRQILAINNMPIEETRVKKENAYKDIMEFAGGIILHRERHSKDNPGSAEKLGQIRDKYATRNEDTFMKKYWGKLIRDERGVEITEEPVENTRERQYRKATDLVKTHGRSRHGMSTISMTTGIESFSRIPYLRSIQKMIL